MKVVMLSGWKRSGKSTAAEALVKGWDYKEISLAAPLKGMVAQKYGIYRPMLDDQRYKESAIVEMPFYASEKNSWIAKEVAHLGGKLYWSPRSLCIWEGQVARLVEPGYWINAVVGKILVEDGNIVVPDVRFPNEVEAIKAVVPSAILVRIHRYDTPESLDASERSLDNYPADYFVDNDGTVMDLYSKVKEIHLGRADDTTR